MLLILIILLCFLVAWLTDNLWQRKRLFVGFKSPPAHPLIGHPAKLGFNPKDILGNLTNWAREYDNDMYLIWLGTNPYIIITDPKHVEVILSSTKILKKTDLYYFLESWLKKGLLTSDGPKWHARRKIITPSFHFKILVDFLKTMNECGDKFIKVLQNMPKENVVDFQPLASDFTLDVICETAMGVTFNAIEKANSKVANAFSVTCRTMLVRMSSVSKRSDILFMLTPDYWQQRSALKVLRDFTTKVISSRKEVYANIAANTEKKDENVNRRHAFLDTLLQVTINEAPLSDSDIDEEVATFMFEGHDTVASGITFAVYLLSRHPQIQQKVWEEQELILGGDQNKHPTYQEVQEMKYLELVIKEAQRMFPSVPIIGRFTEDVLKIDGKAIPPNTGILINIIGMGYNEKYFKDPERFMPERFEADNRQNASPYEYVPFSAGPRNCIGQKFAMLEMKSILSKIIRNFEILPPIDGLTANGYFKDMTQQSPYYPIFGVVLTLKSNNGVQVRLRERNKK